MPKIGMSADLGTELSEAARWYAGEAEMVAFLAHIRTGHQWSERRPRRLLAWAARHAVPVFGHKRFVLVLNAGFDCPERWRLWRAAKAELRRARAAIARGEEVGMIYSDGRDLLVFAESGPRRWGPTENVLRPSWGASPAGPMPATEPPSPPPGASEPTRPMPPRGSILTR